MTTATEAPGAMRRDGLRSYNPLMPRRPYPRRPPASTSSSPLFSRERPGGARGRGLPAVGAIRTPIVRVAWTPLAYLS
jgi:hypothetical protein